MDSSDIIKEISRSFILYSAALAVNLFHSAKPFALHQSILGFPAHPGAPAPWRKTARPAGRTTAAAPNDPGRRNTTDSSQVPMGMAGSLAPSRAHADNPCRSGPRSSRSVRDASGRMVPRPSNVGGLVHASLVSMVLIGLVSLSGLKLAMVSRSRCDMGRRLKSAQARR